MKSLSYIAASVLAAVVLIGCSGGESLEPSESMADQLNQANIKTEGVQSKSDSMPKAGDKPKGDVSAGK